uniref:Sulfur carrier protein n=1 Tax=Candidatus Kentrum eta TaxID=2126337 RepID=A0A450UFG4_9GAMM|nr:MAG: sulfur carrier protein [Candidatus Kentron sp. H]VFJ91263.1 MAG: sulfur carrier protein [Candidatus Kentron sp. H]VFJ97810.1 MAG: sulfur carrier protein [Candidatus Kentron sp. H]
MNIVLNGKPRELTKPVSVARLLEIEGVVGKRIAVEVNEEIVPRGEHGQYELHEDDRVEIVRAIGGG